MATQQFIERNPELVKRCKSKMYKLMTPNICVCDIWEGRTQKAYNEMWRMKRFWEFCLQTGRFWHKLDSQELLAFWDSATTTKDLARLNFPNNAKL
jgi:hypothetical protein